MSIKVERTGPGDPELGVHVQWKDGQPPGRGAAISWRKRGWAFRLAWSAVAALAVAGAVTAYAGTARQHALAGRGGVAAALASGFTGTFLMVGFLVFVVWTVAAWRRRTRVPR
ncbi:MAG: hypothetical protein ACRDRJ_22905 [Streptosporangiaceae bacterium]